MERKISEAKYRFIAAESKAWVEGGLITAEQRTAITDGYAVARNLPAVILTLGVSMIGIGILSLIAANWQQLSAWLKIIMIIASYLASVTAAYLFERRGRSDAGGLLMFFSGFLLLGGLALTSQIFHIEGRIESLLGVWLLVYAPTFLLVRTVSIYALYEVVAIVYMNLLYGGPYAGSYGYGDLLFFPLSLLGPYQPTLLLLALMGVAWYVWHEAPDLAGNPAAVSRFRRFWVGGSTRRIFYANFFFMNWFSWVCALNNFGRAMLSYVMGFLIIGAVIAWVARRIDSSDLDMQGLFCIGVSGLALTFPRLWTGWRGVGFSDSEALPLSLLASALLGAYLIHRILFARRGGGFAVLFFCLLLLRWYVDTFYSFMSKSMFFILGGVLLLCVVYAYKKWNRLRQNTRKDVSSDADKNHRDI